MKKNSFVILGVAMATAMLCLTGCSKSSADGANTEVAQEAANPLKATEIYDKIKASYTLPDMYEADDDWLMNYYGIDASMLSDYVFAEADEVHADRVIILNVAEESNVSAVEEKLNAVLDQLQSPEMLSYLPDQADVIKAASIKKKGNTLYLVISADADGIEGIIENGLLGK